MSSGSLHAVRFVLQVWNSSTDWKVAATDLGIEHVEHLEPFNVARAFSSWDDAHRDDRTPATHR